MTRQPLSQELRAQLTRAALIDGVCVLGGLVLFLVTDNWIWLVAGALLGLGFILPALITVMKSRR